MSTDFDVAYWEMEAEKFQTHIDQLEFNVRGIIAQLDELRGAGGGGGGGGDLSTVRDEVKRLVELVDDHEAALDALTKKAKAGKGPAPWAWAVLDRDAALTRRRDLASWVNWFNDRWRLSTRRVIPPCWPLHGAAEEVLSALWEAYKAAYLTGGPEAAPNNGPSNWVVLHLSPALNFLFDDPGCFSGCTVNAHESLPAPPPQVDLDTLAQLTAADLATRPEPQPKEPTDCGTTTAEVPPSDE